MDDAINLGGRLVKLRGDRSARAVAVGAGIPKTTYERRELDATNLTYQEMRGLARYYGLTVAALVEPADGEPTTTQATLPAGLVSA